MAMPAHKVKVSIALAVILLSSAFLFMQTIGPGPNVELRPHLAVGEAMADLAAKAAGSEGRITLIAVDTSVTDWPAAEAQLKGFFRALRRANLQVSATNLIKLDPIRLIRVPSQEFVRLMRKQTPTDVIVSFLGPPVPTPEEMAQLSQKHARVIALCSGDMPRQINLKALFDQQVLDTAVISRRDSPAGLPRTENTSDWFTHFYEVVTSRTAAELPVPHGAALR
jgi:hypothetical protein